MWAGLTSRCLKQNSQFLVQTPRVLFDNYSVFENYVYFRIISLEKTNS